MWRLQDDLTPVAHAPEGRTGQATFTEFAVDVYPEARRRAKVNLFGTRFDRRHGGAAADAPPPHPMRATPALLRSLIARAAR